MPHNHSHACHDEHCDHDHSSDITPATQSLLYSQINFSGVRTLNEETPASGRAVLQKDYTHRLDPTPLLRSDADPQLLLHVPFTGQVRLHSIHIRAAAPAASAPKTLKVYANSEDLDFDTVAEHRATQTFELAPGTSEVQDLGVKRAAFRDCRSLCLFVEDNWGGDEEEATEIGWIGFKGDWLALNREPVEVMYEAAARPSDHKVGGVGVEGVGTGFGSGMGGGRQGM